MEDNYDNSTEDIDAEIAAYKISIKKLKQKIKDLKEKLSIPEEEWEKTKLKKEQLKKELREIEEELQELNESLKHSRNGMQSSEIRNDIFYAKTRKHSTEGNLGRIDEKIIIINEINSYYLRIEEMEKEIKYLEEQKQSLMSTSKDRDDSDDEER